MTNPISKSMMLVTVTSFISATKEAILSVVPNSVHSNFTAGSSIMPFDSTSARYDALRAAYYDPRTGLTANPEKLRQVTNGVYSINEIKLWLKAQSTHQRFLERKKPKPYYPIHDDVGTPFQRCQCDILDLNIVPRANGNHRYIYLLIDCYSDYVVGVPLKSRTDTEITQALKIAAEIVVQQGYSIQRLDSDQESSFQSQLYRAEAKEDDILLNFSQIRQDFSLAFIDRCCRTLRSLVNKYCQAHQTNRWIDDLQDLIANINNSPSKSLPDNKSPAQIVAGHDATWLNEKWEKQSDKASRQAVYQQKIVLGSKVRYLLERSVFDKGTLPKWSNEIATVTKVWYGGIYYSLNNDDNTRFRKYELQLSPFGAAFHAPAAEDDDVVDSEPDDWQVQRENTAAERRRNRDREGIDPYQFSGDPNNSLEYRFRQQLEDLPAKRRKK